MAVLCYCYRLLCQFYVHPENILRNGNFEALCTLALAVSILNTYYIIL